jgi:hypothetical protein
MIFVESKTLNQRLEATRRTRLLQALEQKNLTPMIRSARLKCFEQALLGAAQSDEVEQAIAGWTESETGEPYVRGDLFCLPDHVFFVNFDDKAGRVYAGIVYEAGTPEPFRKLDSFCREIREFLLTDTQTMVNGIAQTVFELPHWTEGKANMPEGFKRFVARQDTDSLYTSLRKDTMSRRILAASRLEDEGARLFLRGAREAHQEGYSAKLLTEGSAHAYDFSIERLEDAGLVEREVQVSCRKTGHALFRLPNAHALAVVTVSDATCSECGAPVADEKVAEVFAPTLLATSLLEDGSWLLNRLHFLLREMGVPESEIAVGPAEGDGHGQMMANISGEPFLIVARDGDLTPTFARWAIDLEIETEASHLVVVATGRIHNQAQLLLLNHSRSRIAAGRDFELVVADTPASAGGELRHAVERVSQRVVAEQLCHLDSGLGFSAGQLVLTKFRLRRNSESAELLNFSADSSPEPSGYNPPLSLAAGAAATGGDAVHIAELISDEPVLETMEAEEHRNAAPAQLNPEANGSWG